jgi:two-component system copper resistance phosphate regulon response regulator CusR
MFLSDPSSTLVGKKALGARNGDEPMNILLIEDERPLALTVLRILRQAGWMVTWSENGEKGYDAAKNSNYDLIILDVLLPKKTGWEILAGLRSAKINVPILMLTAMDEIGDKVKGLDMGADDYLAKPFETPELIARINALLRRDKAHKGEVIQVADLTLDRKSHVVARAGKEISLTRREYDLLEALVMNEGRVLSRETIQERVWSDDEAFSNTVEVFVSTLRKKVDAPYERKLIQTVVGFGYTVRAGA